MSDSYQPISIRQMQFLGRVPGPHIEITGFITYKSSESDGDYHIRVCTDSVNTDDFVICEIIPELPMPNGIPTLHKTVTVRGIARWDFEHGWPEIHPVLEWEYPTA